MVQFLDEIAERFYGVQRKNPMQGMFGDIFKVISHFSFSISIQLDKKKIHFS